MTKIWSVIEYRIIKTYQDILHGTLNESSTTPEILSNSWGKRELGAGRLWRSGNKKNTSFRIYYLNDCLHFILTYRRTGCRLSLGTGWNKFEGLKYINSIRLHKPYWYKLIITPQCIRYIARFTLTSKNRTLVIY